MHSVRRIGYLLAATILGTSQAGLVQAKEEDSAYQWGRWAVLSPAAGGAEPYVAPDTPGAEFNARPGDASQFQPEVASIQPPVNTVPGVGPVDPGQPIVNLPPAPPPPVASAPGVGPVDPGQPIVNLPPAPPPPQ